MNIYTIKFIALAVTAATSLGGCIIFDSGIKCEATPGLAAPLRNPNTGECEAGGYDGSDDCMAYAQTDNASPPPEGSQQFTWGACYSHCEALDEASCIATSGCQAAYLADGVIAQDGIDDAEFWGCWATADNYLSSMQPCETLFADTCTMRDDCSPQYVTNWADARESPPQPQHSFQACLAEVVNAGCYSDDDCGEGFDCTADTECLPPPDCDEGMACPAVCYGTCVPTTPPPLPGNCYGETNCLAMPPSCPEGTLPGVANGCWTGYCIPLSACESPACGALGEAACQAASPTCEPVYQGSDCSCDASGCQCETLTYAYCGDA